ncbi:diketogulonate reductase-like aldo/keto reductase [Trichococcus patagoniensis]|uniref:Diketogulonate reductase-like aldo/keto reductase n=1 Tax=Trichococcus patagoniensis TaxID=382641 RepID=A0A2T5IKF6_9LACT|nr:aldo/keto reductase [Trichococcus patagoniensis]PTQ84290.1 diketogulonate reductase-like aldo/keto reductase [Trichococcus patagoniensis]
MIQPVKINSTDVFPIGIGTYNIGNHRVDEAREIEVITAGIASGAQVIDTAEMYGKGLSERLVGKALQQVDRTSVYLISKVLPENASKKHLAQSLEQSLERLDVPFLDMYLLHWKSSVSIEETIDAMEQAKADGKIRAWGVSNFDTHDLKKMANLASGNHCMANQVKYNLIDRGIEYDLIPYMQRNKMPLIAYSPIAKGNLKGLLPSQKQLLQTIANNHQATIPQILLSWSIRDRQTIAIPKSSNHAHMMDNIHAAEIQLQDTELSQINQFFNKPNKKQSLALW